MAKAIAAGKRPADASMITARRQMEEARLVMTKMCIRDRYCVKKVAVLNSWGKIRSWGCHMVHHAFCLLYTSRCV